jgi:thiol-disulfide isomerase/thioredoxin
MPWCPNCKAEYQEGYTECSDCGIPLVESLEDKSEHIEYVPFFQADDKELAEKLARYFEYSNLKAQLSFDEENELYLVSIPPKTEKQAKKLYQAFIFVESENIERKLKEKAEGANDSPDETADSEQADTGEDLETASEGTDSEFEPEVEYYDEETDSEDTASEEEEAERSKEAKDKAMLMEDSSPYVMKADKYKDLAGTFWIFLIFGVAGLIFVLLNMAGVLSVLSGWMPNTIMLALFLFFLYVAISTNGKAKKVKAEIEAENKLTEEINSWLEANFTEEFVASIHNDKFSEELNYIKMTEAIKELLLKEFGPQNLSYLDRLIDEYYNSHF